MAKPTVIVVGADKGGVGKTTVSRTLLDYFTAHHIPTRAFDTESPKGTLKRFHPDNSDIVDVTSVADQMRIFDTLSKTRLPLLATANTSLSRTSSTTPASLNGIRRRTRPISRNSRMRSRSQS